MKIEGPFGEPDEGDGDHRQRTSGEDQSRVGPRTADQISQWEEGGDDGELADFHTDVETD